MAAADLLRTARLTCGLTQRDLARRAGVSQSTIARIESGHESPRLETLDTLLHACGYEVEAVRKPGHGVDRTQMRELLQVSPRRRLELLRHDVRGLSQLGGRPE